MGDIHRLPLGYYRNVARLHALSIRLADPAGVAAGDWDAWADTREWTGAILDELDARVLDVPDIAETNCRLAAFVAKAESYYDDDPGPVLAVIEGGRGGAA